MSAYAEGENNYSGIKNKIYTLIDKLEDKLDYYNYYKIYYDRDTIHGISYYDAYNEDETRTRVRGKKLARVVVINDTEPNLWVYMVDSFGCLNELSFKLVEELQLNEKNYINSMNMYIGYVNADKWEDIEYLI